MNVKNEILEMSLAISSKRIVALTHYKDYLKAERDSMELIIKLIYKIEKEFNLKVVESENDKYHAPKKVFDDGYIIATTTVGEDISYNNTYDLIFAGNLTPNDITCLKDSLQPTHFACEVDKSEYFKYYYFGFDCTKGDD